MDLRTPAANEARATSRSPTGRPRWSPDDIPWHLIHLDAVAENRAFFYLVASASFMESATDLYTENLVEYFAGDEEVTSWLAHTWLPEELQHGRVLRQYVETAWPEFGWELAYGAFLKEFRPYCDVALERIRSLELASRCVVETGTASYYTTLSRASPDPVLAIVARRIADDEIRHYKHFYRYFRSYQQVENLTRAQVVPALWRRLRMTGGDDSFVVLKHVYQTGDSSASFDAKIYRDLRKEGRELVRDHFPYEMSVRMLLKPLGLGRRAQRLALPVAIALARRLVP